MFCFATAPQNERVGNYGTRGTSVIGGDGKIKHFENCAVGQKMSQHKHSVTRRFCFHVSSCFMNLSLSDELRFFQDNSIEAIQWAEGENKGKTKILKTKAPT